MTDREIMITAEGKPENDRNHRTTTFTRTMMTKTKQSSLLQFEIEGALLLL